MTTTTATVYQTITEHTNGRRQDPDSPTGWVRQAGSERVEVPGKRKPEYRAVWEPADAPVTRVYGSPEHLENGPTGGTIRTVLEGFQDGNHDLYADEVEMLVRHYVDDYDDAMFVLNGGSSQRFGFHRPDLLEVVRIRDEAVKRAARFGIDLTTAMLTGNAR